MKQLDISQVSTAQRLATIINTFNALAPGEEFTVSCNESLFPLLADFQKQFWGTYDWQPLLNGPDYWKGTIIKRHNKDIIFNNIKHFMEMDHARCDQLYAAGEAAILDDRMESGKELLEAFALGMERHFRMEEQIFFPAIEERTGMTQGPTQVMRMEHNQMRNVLLQMKAALAANDSEMVLGIGETLLILMQQHNMKEEGMLYPMGDGHIPDLAEELLKKMQLIET